jgi:hypothetical protein
MAFEVRRADNSWRHDPVDDAWTLVANNRRVIAPLFAERAPDEARLFAELACPLCAPSHPAIDREGAVIALPSPSALAFVEHDLPPPTPFVAGGALGAHEVLAPLGREHHGKLALDERTFIDLLVLFARRRADLARDDRLHAISCAIAPPPYSRTDHLVGQLLATPFTPTLAVDEERCAVCQDARAARAHGRVVVEHDGLLAWVPFAPRSTFHVRLALAHDARATDAHGARTPPDSDAVRALARVFHRVERALASLVPDAPIAIALERVPLRPSPDGIAHFTGSLEVALDVDHVAARALGARVSSLEPSALARALRAALAPR